MSKTKQTQASTGMADERGTEVAACLCILHTGWADCENFVSALACGVHDAVIFPPFLWRFTNESRFFRQTCFPFRTIQRPITLSAQWAVRSWCSRWLGTYFCCFWYHRANPAKMVSSLSRRRFEYSTLFAHYRKYPCCWRLSHRGLGRYCGDAEQLFWVQQTG